MKKNLLSLHLGVLLVLFLSLAPGGCSPKKGKLISFESLSSYYPYPQDLDRFRLYLQEGQPDYVVFRDEGHEERWVYVCKDKVYNFTPLSSEKSQTLQITSQPLSDTKIEDKLSQEDRERLGSCEDEEPGPKQRGGAEES